MSGLIYKISEYWSFLKVLHKVPRAYNDVFKLIVLFNQKSKLCPVFNDIKQSSAAITDEQLEQECLASFHDKELKWLIDKMIGR